MNPLDPDTQRYGDLKVCQQILATHRRVMTRDLTKCASYVLTYLAVEHALTVTITPDTVEVVVGSVRYVQRYSHRQIDRAILSLFCMLPSYMRRTQ